MVAAKRKQILLSEKETAKILGIRVNKLKKICDFFDKRDDDEWDLNEGEHFEWKRKDVRKRVFYEEGAVAIAKYLETVETTGFWNGLVDKVVQTFTQRRQKMYRHLIRRKVSKEFSSLNDAILTEQLVFLERPKIISILGTNGKGLNASIRRIRDNNSLEGKIPLKPGHHYNEIENVEYYSQAGIASIAGDMSHNHGKKKKSGAARKAWTDEVAAEIENIIVEHRKYLENYESKIKNTMDEAKLSAKDRCQVSLKKRTSHNDFDLHVHHLFDRASRPDLADIKDNLLVMHKDIHLGFHRWHGSDSCEPCDFIDYLVSAEIEKFDSPQKSKHLDHLIQKLEKIQHFFEERYYTPPL